MPKHKFSEPLPVGYLTWEVGIVSYVSREGKEYPPLYALAHNTYKQYKRARKQLALKAKQHGRP